MAAIREENKANNNKNKEAAGEVVRKESNTSYGYLNVNDEERKRTQSVA